MPITKNVKMGSDPIKLGVLISGRGSNLQAIIDRTKEKYPRARIVIAGMQVPPNLGEPYAREFRQIFVELSKKNRAALIPFLLQGVGGVAELNLPDGIHPTAEGHKIVAENVWKVIEPVLASDR